MALTNSQQSYYRTRQGYRARASMKGGGQMATLIAQVISSAYGIVMVATHAFVDTTWLKWSLIAVEVVAWLATGIILASIL